jgi:hypothetical protein
MCLTLYFSIIQSKEEILTTARPNGNFSIWQVKKYTIKSFKSKIWNFAGECIHSKEQLDVNELIDKLPLLLLHSQSFHHQPEKTHSRHFRRGPCHIRP